MGLRALIVQPEQSYAYSGERSSGPTAALTLRVHKGYGTPGAWVLRGPRDTLRCASNSQHSAHSPSGRGLVPVF